MVTRAFNTAAVQIDPSYSPGDADVHCLPNYYMAPWDYMSLPSNGVSIGSATFAKLMVTTNNLINYKLTSWSDR